MRRERGGGGEEGEGEEGEEEEWKNMGKGKEEGGRGK